jgi:hypothetical protein
MHRMHGPTTIASKRSLMAYPEIVRDTSRRVSVAPPSTAYG